MPDEAIILTRNCDAMLIPAGTKVQIAKGTSVRISHRLGGNFTVQGTFGIARIEGKDADALSQEIPENTEVKTENKETSKTEEGKKVSVSLNDLENISKPKEEELWDVARTVFDPEIPLNIVDLGLVYKLDLIDAELGGWAVEADMTLTTPGCAMGPYIADDLKNRLMAIPGITDAIVNIVWDPPWSKDMISEEGKMTLGLV